MGRDNPGVRDGTGPARNSYRRRGEGRGQGRRREAGQPCPFAKTPGTMPNPLRERRA